MINEINAEMMLNYLYPELMEEWVARYRGTFYRNYNDDALDVDSKAKSVELARDGFLKMLPQEFISPENKKEKDEELKRRIGILGEGFLPIDSLMFRQSLKLEREIDGFLSAKTSFVLSRLFGIDYGKIDNPMVRDAAQLLPYVRESRGDVHWVRRLLETLTGCKVEMRIGRWSEDDTTRCWLPMVKYSVVRDGLRQADFQRLYDQLKELQAFVADYWMPVETVLRIELITHEKPVDSVILDYSAEL